MLKAGGVFPFGELVPELLNQGETSHFVRKDDRKMIPDEDRDDDGDRDD
jgi:hypothetical protein